MYRFANPFIKKMVETKLTLALAESMTCGLAAYKLSTAKDTIEMFTGVIVCYNPKLKKDLLNISKKMKNNYSCESAVVTEQLTKNLSKLIKADVYASITGLASAGASESKEKSVGTVFFSLKYRGHIYNTCKLFKGTPIQIREKACFTLYDFILSKI